MIYTYFITPSHLIDILSGDLSNYVQDNYWAKSYKESIMLRVCMNYVAEKGLKVEYHHGFNWSVELYELYKCKQRGI